MLKNAYLLAKIGADTAENEQYLAEILPIGRRVAYHGARFFENVGGDDSSGSSHPAPEPESTEGHARAGACAPMLIPTFCSNFWLILIFFANFDKPVLGCIDADFASKY